MSWDIVRLVNIDHFELFAFWDFIVSLWESEYKLENELVSRKDARWEISH